MQTYFIKGETLERIANAIRAKTGISRKLDPVEMPAKIASISTAGNDGVFVVAGESAVANIVDSVLVVTSSTNAGGSTSTASSASVITGPVGYMTVNSADVSESENSLTIGE